MDAEEFRKAGKEMVDLIADYITNIEDRPVLPSVQPFYIKDLIPEEAPIEGEEWKDIVSDVERVIMPGMTHWHSPHFHAYFPTANSFPALLGDMLSGSLACIGFSWIASPACTELEMVMMDWLAKMLGLPDHFLFSSKGKGGGVIQGTASEATLVCLLGARNRIMTLNKEADQSKLVAYCSSQAHSSVERASLLGGVKMTLLPTDENLSLRGSVLEEQIRKDLINGLVPFYVVGTIGTTNTCATDHIEELANVAHKYGLWFHVDAAYAGSSFVCPELRKECKGINLCDSFNTNPHKWLLVNFDCSTLWIKDATNIVDSFNVDPVYLQHEMQGKIPDYRHWQIPLGRRFRSLKMWFVFRKYGVKGLQSHIRRHVHLAREFEQLVKRDNRFDVVFPVEWGLVCFRLKGSNQINDQLNHEINNDKKIHITPSTVNGSFFLRFAVCARTTESHHIKYAWDQVSHWATRVLAVDQ